MIIAIDFDGTIVEHKYPHIGKEIPFATDTIKQLILEGHQIILWTVREGKILDEAIEWCLSRGISFYSVNKNYPEEQFNNKPICCKKIMADLYIDDRNIGGIPDWGIIYQIINNKNNHFSTHHERGNHPRQSWWKTLLK